MDSNEYHAFPPEDEDSDGGDLRVCRFCGVDFGDHAQSCPYGEPDDPLEIVAAENRYEKYLRGEGGVG